MNKPNSLSLNARPTSQKIFPRTIPVYLPNRVEAREKIRARAASKQNAGVSRWIVFAVIISITFLLCVVLNVKAHSTFNAEINTQSVLHHEIQQLQNDNSILADEVDRLQNDSATIERAARQRLNMVRVNERILVPAR